VVDRDAVDACTRAWLEWLRRQSAAFRSSKGELSIKDQTYKSLSGTIEDLCTASAVSCKRLARNEIGSRLIERLGQSGAGAADRDAATRQAGTVRRVIGVPRLAPQAYKWEDIEISFLSDERVQITMGTQTETRNYEEMGFASKQNGTPVLAWSTLRMMAEAGGVIKVAADSRKWADVEKRMQEIRKVLRHRFDLTDDPLPYTKKTRRNPEEFGYRTKFKLGCRPSYKS
jgi:hypothetical protein